MYNQHKPFLEIVAASVCNSVPTLKNKISNATFFYKQFRESYKCIEWSTHLTNNFLFCFKGKMLTNQTLLQGLF